MMELDLFSNINMNEKPIKKQEPCPINDEFNEFHERIKDWFLHPGQPTKGVLKV